MIKKISLRWFIWFGIVAGYAIIMGGLLYFNLFKHVFDINLQNQIIDMVRRNANVLISNLVSQKDITFAESEILAPLASQDGRIKNVVYFGRKGRVRWHKDISIIGMDFSEYDRNGHLETDAVNMAYVTGDPQVILMHGGNDYQIAIPLRVKDNRVAGVISLDVSREQVKKEINDALLYYLLGSIAIFAIMGGVLYWFVIKNVINPIIYLTESIENISTKSFQFDFMERADEIGILARTIQAFLVKVKKELEERESLDKSRHHYEQEWWSSVLAVTIPKGSRAIVVDENNNVMHANFEISLNKKGPVHLLDIFGANQQDIVHIVGQAMDNPGKLFRAKINSGGRPFSIKTLQLASKGGVVRTVIVLEPSLSKK